MASSLHKTGKRRGFTLVEVMIAAAIVAAGVVMLARGFGTAALMKVRHDACLAALQYHEAHMSLFQAGDVYPADWPVSGSEIVREVAEFALPGGFTASVRDEIRPVDQGAVMTSVITYEVPGVGTLTNTLIGYRFKP